MGYSAPGQRHLMALAASDTCKKVCMTNRNRILTIIFAVIAIVALLGSLLDNILLQYPAKPLLMVWIAVYFLLNAKKRSFRAGVLIAFFFSWVGDMFLMFSGGTDNEMFFYADMAGYFGAQVAYIFVFLLSTENDIKGLLLRNPLWIIPLAGYGVLISLFLYPRLEGAMVTIILVYTISLTCMSLAALNRRDRVNFNSFRLVFAGSLFFLVSGSLFAISKYHTPLPYTGFLNMLTYIIAQYLMMRGLILERERPGLPSQNRR
jgi:uncharacterized membrane protein YhhN